MNHTYKHKQIGYVMWAITILVILISTFLIFYSDLYQTFAYVPIIILGIIIAILLNFDSLTVEVSPETLKCYFGPGLIRKNMAIDTIRYYQAVHTPWYWGFGIRIFPGGVLWNVSGSQAIDLFFKDGSRFRLGTDDPQGLIQALQQQTGVLDSLSTEDMKQVKASSLTLWKKITAVIILIMLMFTALFYVQMQAAKINITKNQIEISNLYSFQANKNEIKKVELLDHIPTIKVRTNGFSAFGVLRGYFSLANLGEGTLFIHQDHPPFILIQTADRYVLVNDEDASQTKALYQKINQMMKQPELEKNE